jgi:hypothetical protein
MIEHRRIGGKEGTGSMRAKAGADRMGGPRSLDPTVVRWSVAAFLLALVASVVVLFAPLTMQGEEFPVSPSESSPRIGASEPKVTRDSLLSEEGWSVALPLSIPVLLTAVGVLAARLGARRVLTAIAVLLGAFVWVATLSVGVYYVPAEAALITAAVKGRRS